MIKLKKGKRPRVQKDTDFVFTSFQPDNEVTGSAFLLEIVNEGLKILIDCGAYQDSSINYQTSLILIHVKLVKYLGRTDSHCY